MRRVVASVGVAVLVLLASGCVRLDSTNTFSDHDTITQDVILALEPDAAAQLGIDPQDLTATALKADLATSMAGIDPSKITIEDYVDGDLKGVHVVAKDLTIEEYNAAAAGGGALTGGLGTAITAKRDGDSWIVTIPADESRDVSQIRGASSIGLIADSIDFAITFQFPGPVTSATAGQVDGKRVVLGLEDILTPQEISIKASAKDEIAWAPILRWVGIGAVALVIVGGATALIVQDRRRRSANELPDIPPDVPGAQEANAKAARGRKTAAPVVADVEPPESTDDATS